MADQAPDPDERLVEPLTRREREILTLLEAGFSAPEIAEQLTLAVNSVRWYLRQIYEKLGVNSKRQAINRARALGLLGGAAGAAAVLAITAVPGAAGSPLASEEPAPGVSPFKGLPFFDEADADWFFGREALADRLATRLAPAATGNGHPPSRFLAVVGASGSGKSSLVRAGLLPRLRGAPGRAPPFASIHLLTPTAHPLQALAASLAQPAPSVTANAALLDDLARDSRALHLYTRWGAPALREANARTAPAGATPSRLLLIVDQFEELFTLCRAESERQAFIDNLLYAADLGTDGPVTVLITLRADFYPHCADYAGLRAALVQQQEYIGPMSVDELRQAVERPAALGGWAFEPGLVDQILHDVGDEPGALPLLSHALLETWRHRRWRTLTLRSYAEAGRVQGAIATTAEAVYQSLPPAEQAIASAIFLQLTELGEGTPDTRRRAALSDLLPPGETAASAVAAVLQLLSAARLITQGEGVVEVAHEALIREWPTLRQWLSEDREGLRLHRRLSEAAQGWAALERDPSELYGGPRLAQALEWEAGHPRAFSPLEAEFVEASRARVAREAAEDEAQRLRELGAAQALAAAESRRAAEQTRAASRLRARNQLITGAGVLALLAALAAGFFGLASNRNAQAAQAANTQSAQNLAAAHAASTQAIGQLNEAARQSSLASDNQLAAQAVLLSTSNYPLAVLLAAQANRTGSSYLTGTALQNVLFSNPHLLGFLYGNSDRLNGVAFRPDGKVLASAGDDGSVRLWDTVTHQPVGAPLPAGSPVLSLAFSPDGHTLASGLLDGSVRLMDMAASQWRGRLMTGIGGGITSLAYSPDGTHLALGQGISATVLNAATGQRVGLLTGHTNRVTGVAFSPDGQTLVTSSEDHTVRLWDAATVQPLGAPLSMTSGSSSVAFSPDGKRLAAGSGNDVALWDLTVTPPSLVARLGGPTADVTSVAFSPDGGLLAATSIDGNLRLWVVANHGLVGAPLWGHRGPVTSVAFSPDGQSLATASADQTAALWQVSASLLSLASTDYVEHACDLAGRNLSHAEWGQYLTGQAYRKTCPQWPDSIQLTDPAGLAFDNRGELYVSSCASNQIYRIDAFDQMTMYAGTGVSGFSGDGGPALAADLNCPASLAFDSDGNLYVADLFNDTIRRIDQAGVISTVAGTGQTDGFAGDGGPASRALLYYPVSVAFDAPGNLYISDGNNNRIRKVDRAGLITTFAGNGQNGLSGDGGPATAAQLHLEIPDGSSFFASLAVAADGSVYLLDGGNDRVRKIDPQGIITTIAGGGADALGNGVLATSAALSHLTGLALDAVGNVYVAEDVETASIRYGHVRKIDSQGIITTVAGANVQDVPVDGQPAAAAAVGFPWGLAFNSDGSLYVAARSPNGRVLKVDQQGIITTVVGGRP